MENKERQILSEIMDMMASIRSQLEILDAKMAQLQLAVGQEDADETPIDLDIDDFMDDPVVPAVSLVTQDEQVEVEPVKISDEPSEVADEQVPVSEDRTEGQEELQETEEVIDELVEVAEESVEVVEEVRQEEAVEDLPDDDLPFGDISSDYEEDADTDADDFPIFAAPEQVPPVVKVEQKVKQAVIDSMTDRQAWRTDMPGTQVRDIRSAISLNDRILFINMLFDQDPMAFQDALTRINQMASLAEVVDYIVAERPEWDLESETVYRFMMAVRRKVR
jgi:hypothetical protein